MILKGCVTKFVADMRQTWRSIEKGRSTLPPSPSASTHRQSVTVAPRHSSVGIISSRLHLLTRFCSVAAVTGVVRAAAAAQCIPLRRRQRQCHRLQLSIATLSSTISPSLCHHSHHYQPQSIAMSDNVEINSSSAPDLSRNVEDKIDNEVEEISVSTVNDKKSKEETRKKKKVSEAWEHFTKIMNQPDIEEALQGSLKVIKREDGTCGISYGSFDQNVLRSLIARMVIMHELPLRFVEYIGFREMMAHANPVVKPMSRNTLKSEILKLYQIEKVKTLHLLGKNHGRVAITTDLWTVSNQKKGYMVVTAHFIDNSWKLHSRILRFIYVPSPHTADALCNELVQCLLDWNVDRKLSSVTLDNCTTNDAMVEKLLLRFDTDTLISSGKFFHMRCTAHILNLVVRDGLKVIESGIGKIRESVSHWTQTPKRYETFELAARQLQINCKKKLKLDCPTRWNSTYAMLEVALMYRSVFSRLQQRDPQYKSLPSEEEWDLAVIMVEHLKSFYMLTEMFSGTKYPTANLFFPLICKMKLSINRWRTADNLAIRIMADKMTDKFDKYWNEIHPMLVVAIVLDPRYKMMLIHFYFPKIYGDTADELIECAHKLCYDLVKEYESKAAHVSGGQNVGLEISRSESCLNSNKYWDVDEFETFRSQNKRAKVTKSELDRYLDEELLDSIPDFDILAFWKMHTSQYPILAELAKDILAIPVSTVASESAFSAGGRFLSPHRSKLLPDTLEALMCAQNWIWASTFRGGVPEDEIFTGEEKPGRQNPDPGHAGLKPGPDIQKPGFVRVRVLIFGIRSGPGLHQTRTGPGVLPSLFSRYPEYPEAIGRGACNFVFVIRARGGRVPFNEVEPEIIKEQLLKRLIKELKSSLDWSLFVNHYAKPEENVR
ncbi:BED-type domain-containing protein [Citrus sinensis]|nr:BED-type domain-containing protein [Citrus sinensis]